MRTRHFWFNLCCCGSYVSCVKYGPLMAYCKHRWDHSIGPPKSLMAFVFSCGCAAACVHMSLVWLFARQMHQTQVKLKCVYVVYLSTGCEAACQSVCVRALGVFSDGQQLITQFFKRQYWSKVGPCSGWFLLEWVCVSGLHVKEEHFGH